MSDRESGRGIDWRDGYPYPVYIEPYNKQSYTALFPIAAAMKYLMRRMPADREYPECGNYPCHGCATEQGEVLPGERDFIGMTNAQVAAIRQARRAASGDGEAFEKMSDRIIGKPKQEVVNTNIQLDLKSVLADIMTRDPKALIVEAEDVLIVEDQSTKEIDWLGDM